FDFAEALGNSPRHAWQVDRAHFDAQLAERARALGAEIVHGAKVVRVELEPSDVRVHTRDRTFTARYLVDASGQNRLLARHHASAVPYETFGRTAAFVHYEGLGDAAIEEIGPGNDIRIMIAEHGWGWVIPLSGRRLSVGLVCREGDAAAHVIDDYIASSALIGRWIQGTRASPVRVERNFSYENRTPFGVRFACIGDAACFLDPVFSSGVSLALVGARSMVEK